MKKTFILIIPLLLFASYSFFREIEHMEYVDKQKGVCWVGQPQAISKEDVMKAKALGINWISQTPFGWQQAPGDTSLHFESNTHRTPWWGESMAGIAATVRYAKQCGVHSLLKPHIWLRQSWPGEIEMKTEEDWRAWFKNYERFIVDYAILADSSGIDIVCIGTELGKTIHRPEWFSIIKKIRSVYKGKLTYAANFNEFERVPFWKELDYIGVQAYFPLTKNENPGVEELEQGWEEHLQRVDRMRKKMKKTVLITELGYKSTRDAAIEPWVWPSHERTDNVSEQTQANAYTAFFKVWWNKEWLAGVYFWKWYPQAPRRSVAGDFTPQGKAAEVVMKEWFSKK